VTFKDLKKRLTLETAQESKALERISNKPFWIWDIEKHKQEDINTKDEIAMFDYEKILYDSILDNEHSNALNLFQMPKIMWTK
jgi:hypothetical protein